MADGKLELPSSVTDQISALKWIKIIVVGNQKSGKTSLVRAFCEQPFNAGYQPTVGVDYGFKMQIIGGEEFRVTLWDLSGSNEYVDVRSDLYDSADGVILVTDVSDVASFSSLTNWLRELEVFYSDKLSTSNEKNNNSAHPNVVSIRPELLIVANKIDLRTRVVSQAEVKRFCDARHLQFVECSAAKREGVEAAFLNVLQRINKRKASS